MTFKTRFVPETLRTPFKGATFLGTLSRFTDGLGCRCSRRGRASHQGAPWVATSPDKRLSLLKQSALGCAANVPAKQGGLNIVGISKEHAPEDARQDIAVAYATVNAWSGTTLTENVSPAGELPTLRERRGFRLLAQGTERFF